MRTYTFMAKLLHFFVVVTALLVTFPLNLVAETSTTTTTSPPTQQGIPAEVLKKSLLQDWNGAGKVTVVAFGDSLTRGTGDFTAPGIEVETVDTPKGKAGYPMRVEKTLNFPIRNAGVPGEKLAEEGVYRFITLIKNQKPDIVVLSEGANDAIGRFSASQLFRLFQTMINIATANGTKVVLATIPPSCCIHDGREPITNGYNQQIYSLTSANSLGLANIHRAFMNTCGGNLECYLLNLPEGLHPNTAGYDVMGEMIASYLLGFDILVGESAVLYEKALKLPPGSLKTVPSR